MSMKKILLIGFLFCGSVQAQLLSYATQGTDGKGVVFSCTKISSSKEYHSFLDAMFKGGDKLGMTCHTDVQSESGYMLTVCAGNGRVWNLLLVKGQDKAPCKYMLGELLKVSAAVLNQF